ncbi:acyl-CoA dehydratase activase-related protein [Eubacteriales bacterium OttesenSCG-928-A19]|nr:acyl-CoA dehydratase activase-related protein [Eubacteriales bacterium OttesenSCG-928-A19]
MGTIRALEDQMTIGIPQAFLYHRYHVLWETFFETLGITVVKSGVTDRRTLAQGTTLAIDEACLSSKVYLGHVDALIDRCDAVFVPRIANLGYRNILCTKFMALYDIVANTFRDRDIKLLEINIDVRHNKHELPAFLELGKQLGARRTRALQAYMLAKQAEQIAEAEAIRTQNQLLERDGTRILIVGHSYNVNDAMIGGPVLDYLRSQRVIPILADVVDRRRALEASTALTDTLPWIYNRELVGAVQLYREQVDGMILLSTFPCGPDSLVNEILIRRVKGMPTLNLLLDGQEGSAGVETRLESFLDILQFRKEAWNVQA